MKQDNLGEAEKERDGCFVKKEKRRNFIYRWLLYFLDTVFCIVMIYRSYQDPARLIILAAFFISSFLLLNIYFAGKRKKMYLNCSLEDVDEMTGIEFETFLYYKFSKRGYRVKTTPVTGDYGADLILKRRKEKIVVQAKRYQRCVGIAAVQEVIGSIAFYGADEGMVVTNSFFTPNAYKLAKANDIVLWDRMKVIQEFLDLDIPKGNNRYCPRCGRKLVYRNGKYGYFLGCTGYPSCNYTAPASENEFLS